VRGDLIRVGSWSLEFGTGNGIEAVIGSYCPSYVDLLGIATEERWDANTTCSDTKIRRRSASSSRLLALPGIRGIVPLIGIVQLLRGSNSTPAVAHQNFSESPRLHPSNPEQPVRPLPAADRRCYLDATETAPVCHGEDIPIQKAAF